MLGPLTSAWLLLLTASLLGPTPLHAKSLSAGHGGHGDRGGRGLDLSVGGARRLRRDLRDSLPYEAQMMSYPTARGGGNNDLYYQPDEWRGHGLGQALQRLVESDQRRQQQQEQEEEADYLAGLFRLLNEAESAGLVNPGDVGVMEEEEAEEEEQELIPPDYDDTGLSTGKTQAAWWGLPEDRMEPQLAQVLLDRLRLEKLQQAGLAQRPGAGLSVRSGGALAPRSGSGVGKVTDQDTLRYLVAKILSSISPGNTAIAPSSGRRLRRDLSVTTGGGMARAPSRSLDDVPPSPSSDPPLLRVKRLGEEEEGWREREEEGYRNTLPSKQQAIGLQRMKRIDTMATDELNHGNHRRRRRAAVNYNPRLLVHYLLQYIDQ